ncbi:MAG: two-component regulator propeller domain-containing protein [Bacteroidota bacterium]
MSTAGFSIPKLFFFTCCILFSQLAVAYPANIKYLGIEQGLSNNSVRCIYQDHNGFMWFGTYDGLNRYDGYSFKVFRNKMDDTSSLPHNYIYTIFEDQQNNLWVGTGQGIGIYNALSLRFSPAWFTPWQTKRVEKITVNVNTIQGDKKGNIFIGTNGRGLLVRKAGTTVAVQVPYDAAGSQALLYNVQSCTIDEQQRVWLFLGDFGLCTYDYATGKIVLVNSGVRTGYSIKCDDVGSVWIGSTSGLYRYGIQSKALTRAYEDAPGQLTSNTVAQLFFTKDRKLWIGTEGGGIDILNTATGEMDYILSGQSPGMLSSESVFAVYEDRESRKWIGTLKGGINVIDATGKRFQSIAHNSTDPQSLIYNFVSCFYEDTARNLWVGTDGGGMSKWNRATNRFTNFRHQPGEPSSLNSNLITSICQDYEGALWIATYGGGVDRYRDGSGVFEHYKCINPNEENKNAWLVYEDRDKNLWATTFSNGRLYRFNRQRNQFEMFDSELTDLISIHEDASGKLWAGNSYQLMQVDKLSGKHQYYEIGKPVRAIYEDRDANLWLGSEGGGLILFDRKQGKIAARYSDADGLCNNSVLNILEDGSGNLWLSTFNGLSRFRKADKTFKNYYQSDGLQSNQFLYNAALRLSSGELVFGGIKGFTLFNPDSIQFRGQTPPVFLTAIRVNSRPVSADSAYVTKTSDNLIRELRIPYDDAVLSFDFAALEYTVPDKIQYSYWLEGWDKGWNLAGNVRTANYTRLKEGTFYFHVRCTNANGDWSKEEATIRIIILPPWFRSWWAYLLYVLTVLGAVYVYVQYKTRQTRLLYDVKIARINARNEREANEKKLSFFTNIAHEFRTPLTLILNPVKDLLARHTGAKDENADLNIVYRNARRLLNLVDQLLLFRKADSEAGQLKITRLNYSVLCHDVYLCFLQQARLHKISYTFTCPDDLFIYGDRQKIEIALYNLLSNALKHTPDGGAIGFSVVEKDANIITVISDTGSGISAEAGNKIFNKFYQAVDKKSVSRPGVGIGLYLVKNFAESHHGSIQYTSEPGKGSIFTLSLPKDKDHFENEFIGEEDLSQEMTLLPEIAGPEQVEMTEVEKMEGLVSGTASILVVDDNEQMLQYIVSIFTEKYKVFSANSAEEGLRIAKEYLPDLIISDVVMGGMSGMDFCKTIKTDTSLGHIPVILLTGSLSPEAKLKGIEHGADDYITKPFEKELLVARVVNLLQNRTILQNFFYNEITLQKSNLKVSAEYKKFLEECITIVEAHLDDDQFTIKTLASEIGMSHSNLYKKVKSISGQSVNAFIRYIRLRKAAELLINTNQNVNETAFQVGISNVKYFREQFHKLFGVNPSEYIKKYRKAFSKGYRVNKEAFGEEEQN